MQQERKKKYKTIRRLRKFISLKAYPYAETEESMAKWQPSNNTLDIMIITFWEEKSQVFSMCKCVYAIGRENLYTFTIMEKWVFLYKSICNSTSLLNEEFFVAKREIRGRKHYSADELRIAQIVYAFMRVMELEVSHRNLHTHKKTANENCAALHYQYDGVSISVCVRSGDTKWSSTIILLTSECKTNGSKRSKQVVMLKTSIFDWFALHFYLYICLTWKCMWYRYDSERLN